MDAWFLSTSSCLGSWCRGTQGQGEAQPQTASAFLKNPQVRVPKDIVVPRCILGASEFTLAFSQYKIRNEKVHILEVSFLHFHVLVPLPHQNAAALPA